MWIRRQQWVSLVLPIPLSPSSPLLSLFSGGMIGSGWWAEQPGGKVATGRWRWWKQRFYGSRFLEEGLGFGGSYGRDSNDCRT
jgi:hypothetical protein